MPSRRAIAPLLLLTASTGACSERSFREVADMPDDDDTVDEDAPSPSAWDALDDLTRPQATLAATWHDRDQIDITPNQWRCTLRPRGGNRFGFLDLDGRLLLEVTPPMTSWLPVLDPLTEQPLAPVLSAAGPDRFLAISLGTSEEDGGGRTRHAWLADGTEETTEDWLTWEGWSLSEPTAPGVITTHPGGTTLALPQPILDLSVVADPTQDRVVWIAPLYAGYINEADSPVLLRLPLDALDQVRTWTSTDLLGGHGRQPDIDGYLPGTLRVSLRGGRTRVGLNLIGVSRRADRPTIEGPAIVIAFDPSSNDVSWTREVSYGPLGASALDVLEDGTLAWLGTAYGTGDGGLAANLDFQARRPDVLTLDAERDGSLRCARTVALLDAGSGTAMFQAVPTADGEEPGSSAILITHRGERVLRIDGVREGLGTTEVVLHDVAVLDGL